MDWGDDDGSHAYICGVVAMSVHSAQARIPNITKIEIVDDGFGNHTNVTRITMKSGNQYDVTTTRVVAPPQ